MLHPLEYGPEGSDAKYFDEKAIESLTHDFYSYIRDTGVDTVNSFEMTFKLYDDFLSEFAFFCPHLENYEPLEEFMYDENAELIVSKEQVLEFINNIDTDDLEIIYV